jgi:hypothetical protein
MAFPVLLAVHVPQDMSEIKHAQPLAIHNAPVPLDIGASVKEAHVSNAQLVQHLQSKL